MPKKFNTVIILILKLQFNHGLDLSNKSLFFSVVFLENHQSDTIKIYNHGKILYN